MADGVADQRPLAQQDERADRTGSDAQQRGADQHHRGVVARLKRNDGPATLDHGRQARTAVTSSAGARRSEDRRGGEECGGTCRSLWPTDPYKKKNNTKVT